ncbi:hypothetical protein PVAP13_9KG030100 [Panicum virgatum]|uniref:Uncharacterized protein n=1 Tax=Panicum virgatum TaxID=38727 RepID=A0A8T0NE98_PANVG|nr:hypothetical protein PVAP13_9KG030100 [Panicum virgatum]
MPPAGSLSSEQLSFFDANGYLVLESFSGEQDVRALRDRIAELVAGSDDGTQHHRVEVVDDYFSNSAENISFFYEDKAFGVDGCLKQPKELSIRFVGNALHEHDPVFKRFSFSENISNIFPSLGYKRPAIVQSRYIFKLPVIGSEAIPIRIIHSYTRNLNRARDCGLHFKMQLSAMVAYGQFQDHIKMV